VAITLAQIVDAVETTLSAAVGLARSQTYDEITSSLNDFPLLQVYPESWVCDPSGGTERSTFGGHARQHEAVIHADLFAGEVVPFGERMGTLVGMIDALMDVLEAQMSTFFGVAGIRALHWSWQRAVIDYGDKKYLAARFVITVTIF
jgi:hypothetical protein